MTGAPPIGVYSIGVRGMSLPELFSWAARHGVPHLHLRGGTRGYRLSEQNSGVLRTWAELASETVPVTAVTTDVDLVDLLAGDRDARSQMSRLADAAAVLGATTLRIFGRKEPEGLRFGSAALPDVGLALAVELHAAGWFDPRWRPAIDDLLPASGRLRLLADTYQVQQYVPDLGAEFADWLVARSRIVHFCDPGSGLSGPGHRHVAAAVARAAAAGHQPELAFEWIGPDRSAAACLARYRAAVDWWEARW